MAMMSCCAACAFHRTCRTERQIETHPSLEVSAAKPCDGASISALSSRSSKCGL